MHWLSEAANARTPSQIHVIEAGNGNGKVPETRGLGIHDPQLQRS
jgi:hypothetical protein